MSRVTLMRGSSLVKGGGRHGTGGKGARSETAR